MAKVTLDKPSIKLLWAYVDVSRKRTRDEWQARLDLNRDLYQGKHWDPLVTDGLKQVTVNYTGAGIEIKNAAQTYQKPKFDAQPVPQPESTETDAGTDPQSLINRFIVQGDDPQTAAQKTAQILQGQSGPQPPSMGMASTGDAQGQMGAVPPSAAPNPGNDRRKIALVISEYLTRLFVQARGWDTAQACLLDKRVYGIGVGMTLWDEGYPKPPTPEGMNDHAGEMDDLSDNPAVALQDFEPDREMAGTGGVCLRISPYDLIIDPTVDWSNWEDASFIGRVYTVEKARLERDTRFKGIKGLNANAQVRPTNEMFLSDPVRESLPEDTDHPYVILCEVWYRQVYLKGGYRDDDGNRYPSGYYPLRVTWAIDKTDEPIRCEVWPYALEDERGRPCFPFRLMTNRALPGELRGQGDPEIAQSQQELLNHSRAVESTHADRLARGKYIAVKNALDKDAKAALASPTVGAVADINTGGQPLAAVLLPAPVPAMKPEVEIEGEHAMRDLNALTGVDEAAQGVAVQGAQTATEINLIAAKSGARAAKEDEEFDTFLAGLAEDLWQLERQFGKPGSSIPVTLPMALGGNGSPQAVTIGDEHLIPAQITVVAGSTKLKNQQQEVQGTMQALQVLSGLGLLATAQNPDGQVNSRVLVERLLQGLNLDNGDPDLYSTDEFKQIAAQKAQALLAAQNTVQGQQQQQLQQLQGGAPQPGAGGPPGASPGGV